MPTRCLECGEIIETSKRKHQMQVHGLKEKQKTDTSKFSELCMEVQGISGTELLNFLQTGVKTPQKEPRYIEHTHDNHCYLIDNYANCNRIVELFMVSPGKWEPDYSKLSEEEKAKLALYKL